MLTYIIYSHTDFLDILKIQTHKLKSYRDKILLINKSDLDLSDIYSQYEKIIFYDDALPYASRILSLVDLDLEYVLFIHDIDIIITKNNKIINHFVDFMKTNDIDRIDLQVRYNWDLNNSEKIYMTIDDKVIELRRQVNAKTKSIYNVNPSIWKLSALLNIMNQFKNETYRSIELNVQEYCSKFKIYKLYSDEYISCGWFSCLSFFQFLHITHRGKLLPILNNNLNEYLKFEYTNILSEWLSDTSRTFADAAGDIASPSRLSETSKESIGKIQYILRKQ